LAPTIPTSLDDKWGDSYIDHAFVSRAAAAALVRRSVLCLYCDGFADTTGVPYRAAKPVSDHRGLDMEFRV
jgi:hypothetical protein